jgi:hypothetical protein
MRALFFPASFHIFQALHDELALFSFAMGGKRLFLNGRKQGTLFLRR